VALIEGFSIFCDWENVDDPINGGISLVKLNNTDLLEVSEDEDGSPKKKKQVRSRGLLYFSEVLKREFSD